MDTATWFLAPRKGRLVVLAIAFVLVVASAVHAGDRWETLEAIHWVENPHNSTKPGPKGELGAYQFRESTWRMHTAVPFARALDRQASDTIAVRHYEWLRRQLSRHGFTITPYNIALAWNAGMDATVHGAIPASSRRYAERVNSIAAELRERTLLVAGR